MCPLAIAAAAQAGRILSPVRTRVGQAFPQSTLSLRRREAFAQASRSPAACRQRLAPVLHTRARDAPRVSRSTRRRNLPSCRQRGLRSGRGLLPGGVRSLGRAAGRRACRPRRWLARPSRDAGGRMVGRGPRACRRRARPLPGDEKWLEVFGRPPVTFLEPTPVGHAFERRVLYEANST